jgi:DNA-binding MarR family transcriptional regulator
MSSQVDNKKQLLSFADRVSKTCVAFKLRSLNRIVTGIYNDAFRSRGISVGQFTILTAVLKAEPVSPIRLSAILRIDISTLSRNLDLMCRNGWIKTEKKGRGLLVSITKQGALLYAECMPNWIMAQKKAQRIFEKEKIS